jgi:hypothetical protein
MFNETSGRMQDVITCVILSRTFYKDMGIILFGLENQKHGRGDPLH